MKQNFKNVTKEKIRAELLSDFLIIAIDDDDIDNIICGYKPSMIIVEEQDELLTSGLASAVEEAFNELRNRVADPEIITRLLLHITFPQMNPLSIGELECVNRKLLLLKNDTMVIWGMSEQSKNTIKILLLYCS